MKLLATIALILLSVFLLSSALAAGGQVQVQENCTVVIPPNFDTEDCDEVTSSPSGLHTFLVCYPELVVICESEGDPGQIGQDDDRGHALIKNSIWYPGYEPQQINSDPVTGMLGFIESMEIQDRGYLWSDKQ